MKPVEQTIARPPKGDCFRACIASILELPIEETPNPPSDPDGHWWNEWIDWLAPRGYELIQWTVPENGAGEQRVCGAIQGYWIATVPSLNAPPPPPDRPNLGRHAIVMHGDQIAHDPSTGEKWSMENWASAGGQVFEVTLVHPLDPVRSTQQIDIQGLVGALEQILAQDDGEAGTDFLACRRIAREALSTYRNQPASRESGVAGDDDPKGATQ